MTTAAPTTSPDLAYPPPAAASCDVLARALDVVLADPDAWDQETWGYRRSCGTSYCIAGTTAVVVLGHEPDWLNVGEGCAFLHSVRVDPADPRAVDGRRAVDCVAAEGLGLVDATGLPDDRADALFVGDRSLRRLVELAWLYSGGRVDRFAAYAALAAARPDVAASDDARERAQGCWLAREVRLLRDRDAPATAARAWWVEALD